MALKDKTKNQVNVIHPYRTKGGIWCFDDEEVGLQAEPFVGTVNKMIDIFAEGKSPIVVYISKDIIPHFSGHLVMLDVFEQQHAELEGEGWYYLDGTNLIGWLCPALLKYFEGYPDDIYFKVEI